MSVPSFRVSTLYLWFRIIKICFVPSSGLYADAVSIQMETGLLEINLHAVVFFLL